MCFSAEASFGAAAVLGTVGAVTVPVVRNRRELPLAALPLLFAGHQFVEGLIWLQLDEGDGAALHNGTVEGWLLFALVLLPIWLPVSVWLMEPDPRRRRAMLALLALGAWVGVVMIRAGGVAVTVAQVGEGHIRYGLPVEHGWQLAVPYGAATCLPLLLSSHRYVVRLGVGLVASMLLAAAFTANEFPSTWCFFAAVLSAALAYHHWTARRGPTPGRHDQPAPRLLSARLREAVPRLRD